MIINAIQCGQIRLFSHFDSQGTMWAGEGNREISERVHFDTEFLSIPTIQISVTLLDASSDKPLRYSLTSENVDNSGFDVVFKTWLDSRFARVWVSWIALGESKDPDMWDV